MLCLFGLGILFFFQAAMSQILDGDYTVSQILIYQSLNLPSVFIQMTPPAVMMATAMTLTSLSRTHELVACYSIGVGLPHIIVILLSLVFMLSCFTLVIQDRIVPPFYNQQLKYFWTVMKGKSDFFLDVSQDKVWYRSGDMIFNLRHFDSKEQRISGMSVYSFSPEFELDQVTHAESAVYYDPDWHLRNGQVTVFVGDDRHPATQSFEEKILKIDEPPSAFLEIQREVNGFRLKELYRHIQKIRKTGVDTKEYEVKLHYRISLSFIPLIMALLAVPFSVGLRRSGGLERDLGIGLGITIFYWLFYSVGLSLGKSGAVSPWVGAWSPSFIFALAGGMLFWRKVGSI
jgi:lipopolysaccharide export system permease protein